MANHNLPTLTSTYSDFVSELDGRLDDLAAGMDPAVTTVTNPPSNSIRWNSADKKWEKWSGTAWNELSSNYAINLQGPSTVTANSTGDALKITQTGSGNAFVVEDDTSPDSTPFVIDSTGTVLKGLSSARNNIAGGGAALQLEGPNTADSAISVVRRNNAGAINVGRQNGTSNGDNTSVGSPQVLGALNFIGADGTNLIRAASVTCSTDGAVASGSMPGSLVFATTPSGSSTPSERVSISSEGHARFTASTTGVSGIELYRNSPTESSRLFFTGIGNEGYAIYKSNNGLRFTYGAIVGSTSGTTGILMTDTGGLQIARSAVTSPAASDGNVFSGSYTPTLTAVTNVASSTAYTTYYMRVGNIVTVSGHISITATAAATTTLTVSLPIASNLVISRQCAGTFASSTVGFSNAGVVYGDASAEVAVFRILAENTNLNNYMFNFTYQVA